MRLLSFALASLSLLTHVRSLTAQVTRDSTPATFHQGEWGVGFVQGRYLAEGGVLRFSTPTQAWVLDAVATLDREVLSEAGVFGTDLTNSATVISALFGPRWYRGVSSHLARFAGFGLSGGYSRTNFSGGGDGSKTWFLGVYGEVGLQYMFTPHIGLGWRGNLVASRARSTQDSGANPTGTQRTTYYHVAIEPVQVIGTIYF